MNAELSPDRKTTASAAPTIIHGSNADRYQHWLERTGQAAPPDLREVFMVQWGKHNEGFILNWIEMSDRYAISERQRWCPHPTIPGIGATIDGFRAWDDAVIEVKVCGPFMKAETVGSVVGFLEWYAPQVAVQIACRGATRGLLGVQQGNTAPVLYEVNIDAAYTDAVIERLVEFQRCVDAMEPPGPVPAPPVPPEKWRTIDLDALVKGENWQHAMRPVLNLWSDTRETWATHEQAKTDVKVLLPDDVGKVTYRGITIKRARNNAVTIKQEAA